jgi:hypothetical protein
MRMKQPEGVYDAVSDIIVSMRGAGMEEHASILRDAMDGARWTTGTEVYRELVRVLEAFRATEGPRVPAALQEKVATVIGLVRHWFSVNYPGGLEPLGPSRRAVGRLERVDFYLASSEIRGLRSLRRCEVVERLRAESGNDLLLISVDPPVLGGIPGSCEVGLSQMAVSAHAPANPLPPTDCWPIPVYVACIRGEFNREGSVRSDAVEVLGEGVIYDLDSAVDAGLLE